MLVPSIGISKGRAAQTRQGRGMEQASERDPRDLAREFGRIGEIAVVDLDAALGTGDNLSLVEELCGIAPCRVSGGIRDVQRAMRLLKAGARTLVIGTRAEPEFLQELPAARIMVALDARDDKIVDHGWTFEGGESPLERATRLAPYVAGFVYTIVEREGTERGLDMDRVKALVQAVELPVTAAGGITSVDEVVALDRIGIDAQVGTAIYRGTLGWSDAFTAVLDWERVAGTLPTIVQDARDGRVLMLGESTRETLVEAIESGETVLYEHQRGRRRMGDDGGNRQALVRVEPDCERAAVIFHVVPAGPVCHTGTWSCFGSRPFSLEQLDEVIRERAQAPDTSSYTRGLLDDAVARHAKILEEAAELVEATSRTQARAEAADLLFHMLVELTAHDTSLSQVVAELEARRGRRRMD